MIFLQLFVESLAIGQHWSSSALPTPTHRRLASLRVRDQVVLDLDTPRFWFDDAEVGACVYPAGDVVAGDHLRRRHSEGDCRSQLD